MNALDTNPTRNAEMLILEMRNRNVQLIPKLLVVDSLDEAINIIRRARNEEIHRMKRAAMVPVTPMTKTVPQVKNWGPGRSIPDNIKNAVVDELKAGVDPWTVGRKYNVSPSSVQKIKAAAGLVRHRS